MNQTEFESNYQVRLEDAGFDGFTKNDIVTLLEALGEEIAYSLAYAMKHKTTKTRADGSEYKVVDPVVVRGVGRFTVADRPARDGRNPATGEHIKIKASKKLKVTAPKPMRDKLKVK
jgi:DNA-binding protein HU-beta